VRAIRDFPSLRCRGAARPHAPAQIGGYGLDLSFRLGQPGTGGFRQIAEAFMHRRLRGGVLIGGRLLRAQLRGLAGVAFGFRFGQGQTPPAVGEPLGLARSTSLGIDDRLLHLSDAFGHILSATLNVTDGRPRRLQRGPDLAHLPGSSEQASVVFDPPPGDQDTLSRHHLTADGSDATRVSIRPRSQNRVQVGDDQDIGQQRMDRLGAGPDGLHQIDGQAARPGVRHHVRRQRRRKIRTQRGDGNEGDLPFGLAAEALERCARVLDGLDDQRREARTQCRFDRGAQLSGHSDAVRKRPLQPGEN